MYEKALTISLIMFFYVLLYNVLLFLSLEFSCNFFLYHLGSDLQALEVGGFFPIPVSLVLGSLSLYIIPFDAGGSSVHSVTCILV